MARTCKGELPPFHTKIQSMKETQIQKQILDYMKLKGYVAFKHRNVGIFKQDTKQYIPLAFGEKGISDIIACSPIGQFTARGSEAAGQEAKPGPARIY